MPCGAGGDSLVAGLQLWCVDVRRVDVSAGVVGYKIFCSANLFFQREAGRDEYLLSYGRRFGCDLSVFVWNEYMFS